MISIQIFIVLFNEIFFINCLSNQSINNLIKFSIEMILSLKVF
jgi:hypothetical protein